MSDDTSPQGPLLPTSTEAGARFFALAFDLLCVAGLDGVFRQVNSSWTRVLGWSEAELCARPYLEFVHPDDRVATAAEAGKLGHGAVTVSFQNRYRCKDGSYRWLEWTASPSAAEGLIYAVARDRTEQKQAEDENRRTELFLDSIVENIPHMIFVKDAKQLRFLRFNRAGEALLGYPRSALLGKNDSDFFPKEQADFFIAKDREVLRGKELVDIPEEALQTKDKGVRILHTKKLPLLDEHDDPQYLLGISEDITDWKRLDAAKSEFLALASHQLRTPLTAIRWTLELLQEEASSFDASQRRLVRDAHDATVRMAETLQTMLGVSRIEAQGIRLNRSAVRLDRLLSQVQADYATAAGSKGQTVIVACAGNVSLWTDPQLLDEIVGNLVSNAIKYTASGGTIRVQAVIEPGKGVRIDISDTGIGIPSSEQDRIFAKLFRASNAMILDPGGTGLGLYVAASLAKLLGGNLSFVSQEHHGTTFTLTLPFSIPIP